MNIAIFGDSFANGETAGSQKLNHLGLTQYLFDDGHFVVNFSRQGNTMNGILKDYPFHLRQNEHLKFDIALVFQTEACRDSSSETTSIREMETVVIKEFYSDLKKSQDIYNIPIYLIGGTADTLSPDVIKECGLKCACQSLVNLCVNGDHLIEEPTTNFVFYGKDDSLDINLITADDKEYFLKSIEMGDDRYKLMGDNPEYFAPMENFTRGAKHENDHPNRYAYKKLFDHLKSEGIV